MTKLDMHREQRRTDYRRVTGESFVHFHCPMTNRDEPGDLCLGHVVPEKLGASSTATVLQRKDVDEFYGAFVESDMIAAVKARSLPLSALAFDPELNRTVRPTLAVDQEEWKYYEHRNGRHGPSHTPVTLRNERGDSREIVIAKTAEEIDALKGKSVDLIIDRDYVYTMVAALLKAAHLTLFHLLGYSYALSAAGLLVGKDVLGKFFDEQRAKRCSDVKRALAGHFREWRNAVRPIQPFGVSDFRGTIDDGKMLAVHASSGPVFAIGVFIRTNDDLHQVLVPLTAMSGPFPGTVAADCVATYLRFLESPPPYFHAKHVSFNRELKRLETNSESPLRFDWPSEE